MDLVRERLRTVIEQQRVRVLVCSAACGADLLALEVAGELGLRRRVILPFAPEVFRARSVVDRPGEWGPMFDTVVADARERGDLVLLGLPGDDERAYQRANDAILQQALALGASSRDQVAALLVWNGVSRGAGDMTASFGEAARRLGLEVLEVSTL